MVIEEYNILELEALCAQMSRFGNIVPIERQLLFNQGSKCPQNLSKCWLCLLFYYVEEPTHPLARSKISIS